MATFFKKDFIKVELTKAPIYRGKPMKLLAHDDNYADLIGMYVYENGEPVDLDGWQCQGYFIRSTGETIPLVGQTQDVNLAFVQLDPACYDYEGQYSLAIKLVSDSIAETLRIVDGMVTKTTTDAIIDPSGVVPDLPSLLAHIAEMEAATTAATEAAAAATAAASTVASVTALTDGSYKLILGAS